MKRLVLRAPLTAKALQLRDDYRRQVHELIAPAHFPHEIANTLTKAERQKLIPVGDARTLIADVEDQGRADARVEGLQRVSASASSLRA
jgi:hypothetical protein